MLVMKLDEGSEIGMNMGLWVGWCLVLKLGLVMWRLILKSIRMRLKW